MRAKRTEGFICLQTMVLAISFNRNRNAAFINSLM